VIFLLLLFIIPGLLYLIFIKGNMTVFVEVGEEGQVKFTSNDLSPYQLAEAQKLSANLVVKPVQSSMPDGLLTPKGIADALNIQEEEVIKLIESGELKSKKIGDKYFIRKEDFDDFMKK
jgi:excisionase family DNA binding protein